MQIYNKKFYSESYEALNLSSTNYFLPSAAFIVFATFYSSNSTLIGFEADNFRSRDYT